MLRLAIFFPLVTVALFVGALPSLGSGTSNVVLTAKLTGKYLHTATVGSGTARVTLKDGRVCWRFAWKGIGKLAESGIHKAPPPPAGRRKRSILPFKAVTTRSGCVAGNAATIEDVAANPGAYYVDIHTTEYPKGAIGGRLRRI